MPGCGLALKLCGSRGKAWLRGAVLQRDLKNQRDVICRSNHLPLLFYFEHSRENVPSQIGLRDGHTANLSSQQKLVGNRANKKVNGGGKKANPEIIFTMRKINRAAGYADHCGPMQNPSGANKREKSPGAWSGEDAQGQQPGAVRDGAGGGPRLPHSAARQRLMVVYIFFLIFSLL